MENLNKDSFKYLKAKEQVKKIKDFYTHLIVSLIALPVIIYVNLTYSPEFHWFWFAVWGMSFGIIMHWLSSFRFGKGWEEKKINELMRKNKN